MHKTTGNFEKNVHICTLMSKKYLKRFVFGILLYSLIFMTIRAIEIAQLESYSFTNIYCKKFRLDFRRKKIKYYKKRNCAKARQYC